MIAQAKLRCCGIRGTALKTYYATHTCACTHIILHTDVTHFMLGVIHTEYFIRGGRRTEEVDKGSWLVDEAKTP